MHLPEPARWRRGDRQGSPADARHSTPERARDLGNELADRLREGGFSVDRVLVEDLHPVPAVCAMGRPHGG
jgi:hypothetical protein